MDEMTRLAEVVQSINVASGSIAKKEILIAHMRDAEFKELMKAIYNPYQKFGIKAARLHSAMNNKARMTLPDDTSVHDVVMYLSKNNTGSDMAAAYAATYVDTVTLCCGAAAGALAEALVTQTLKIGVSVKTLNDVYGKGFIPVVGVMLGTLYSKVSVPQWPCIVTEKLDGIRRVLIKDHGVVRMYSRSGHEDTGLVDILEEAKYLPDNFVYDGELIADGVFKDNIECRQASASISNSKGAKHGLILNVFDMVPVDEFYAGVSKSNALARKQRLAATFRDESLRILVPEDYAQAIIAFGIEQDLHWIKSVPILAHATNINQVTPILSKMFDMHKEGLMLNADSAPYEVKRSKHLMKLKFTEEKQLQVVDFVEGTGKYEDSLGALIVEYKGARVGVGSGLTDSQRLEIWTNQPKYLHKYVEVETFGESMNQNGGISLNCPIFKRFVGEEVNE